MLIRCALSVVDILAIHVRAQNAGLLVTRIGDQYQFQSFELLARDADVMKLERRLRRQFPGPSMSVDSSHVMDPRFRKALIDVLLKLDRETDWNGPSKHTAGHHDSDDEDFGNIPDTADPRLLTGMMMGVLRGIGRPCVVPGITKRSREEVFLKEGARSPWRRSPLWLMIRVSLQLTLLNPAPGQTSLYKEFMIYLMSYILSESPPSRLPHDLLFFMMAKISRRILKLGSTVERPGFPREKRGVSFAQRVLRAMQTTLENEWIEVQSKVKPRNLSALASLDFEEDTKLQLPHLRQYLDDIAQKQRPSNQPEVGVSAGHPFQRNGRENERLQFFPRSDVTKDKEFVFFELADLEHSVEEFLGFYGSSLDENDQQDGLHR